MSQRVYLIPVDEQLLETFVTAVGDDPPGALGLLRDAASKQSQLSALSKEFAARLDERAFRDRGLFDPYAQCTALRPYVITDHSPASAARAVQTLWSLEDPAAQRQFFEQQIAAFEPDLLTNAPAEAADDSSTWSILEEDLRRLHGLRRATLNDTPYMVPVPKQEPFGDSHMVLSDETETIVLRGQQVIEAYGNLLATCLGRFAGACRPTWWMGRNFWLGLLVVAQLPLRKRLMLSPAPRVQAHLRAVVTTPAELLEPLAISGFEAGLSLCCEAYSAGLYLRPTAVAELLAEVQRQRQAFLELAAAVTRYPKDALSQLIDVVEEALTWASDTGHGLIEGDELVGSLGYR